MKLIFQLTQFTCILTWVVLGVPLTQVQPLRSQLFSSEEPAPLPPSPDTGRPKTTKPGSSRGCSKQLLIPLAIEDMEFTRQERPTFWVYIPYAEEQLVDGKLRFSLRDREDIRLRQYDQEVDISGKIPGVVGISLPSNVPAINLETWYKWRVFVDIYCQESKRKQADSLALIFRKISNSNEINEESFVYDRLTNIALSENEEERQQQWLQFLQSIGLEESQEVLKDKCCTILESLPPVSNE